RPLAAAAAHDARDRRLRPQRKPCGVARLLRGRLPVRHRRHPRRACARRQDPAIGGGRGDQGAQHQSRQGEPCRVVRATAEDAGIAEIDNLCALGASAVKKGHVTDFTLPELGENISSGDVLRVLVKPGDTIQKEQSVLELETDKATIEVPSSVAGTVKEVKVKAGDKVKVGQAILSVDDGGGASAGLARAEEGEHSPLAKADGEA